MSRSPSADEEAAAAVCSPVRDTDCIWLDRFSGKKEKKQTIKLVGHYKMEFNKTAVTPPLLLLVHCPMQKHPSPSGFSRPACWMASFSTDTTCMDKDKTRQKKHHKILLELYCSNSVYQSVGFRPLEKTTLGVAMSRVT